MPNTQFPADFVAMVKDLHRRLDIIERITAPSGTAVADATDLASAIALVNNLKAILQAAGIAS